MFCSSSLMARFFVVRKSRSRLLSSISSLVVTSISLQQKTLVSCYEVVVDGVKVYLLVEMGNCVLFKFVDGKVFCCKEIKIKVVVINKFVGSYIDFRFINCKED